MSRHDDFVTDPAFARAAAAVPVALKLAHQFHNNDPDAVGRMIAMMVLVAFANGGGLEDPHIGRLIRFAPDLGHDAGTLGDH